jgi:T5SS/PEP-CTERM-associated repeat protein
MKTKYTSQTAAKPSWKKVILLAITALALSTPAAFAASTTWTDSIGSWFTDGNWSNHVPTCTVDAYINNGGTAQVSSALQTGHADNLYLGYGTADSGYVSVPGVNGGSLSICGSVFVAYQGTGTMTVTNGGTVGGAVATSGNVSIASLTSPNGVPSNGSVKVDGTGSTWTVSGEFDVGGTTSGAGGTGLLGVTNGGTVSAVTGAHVWNSGTLTGNGTVSANSGSGTVLLDGTLAPNWTLTINGNLHSTRGATTQCNVTPDRTSPSIDAHVSGTATLDTGSKLIVNMTGNFTAGTTYTLLQADTLLNGTFTSVSINYPCECFTPEIQYDAHSVKLYLKPAACCQ